jgi:hypothetical protein
LVEAVWVGIGRIAGTVEPIEVRFVIGNPFLDRLPGRLDGHHRLVVDGGRGRARKANDSLPKSMEAEVEFDFLAPDDGADPLHGALAARTLERVAAPDLEDEVAPEGAHVPGSTSGRGGDEEDLGGRRFFGWRLGFGGPDDAVRDGGDLAAGFVGVEAVVADGLLAFGWEVEKSGGDEVGGLEYLEVALGGVVAFGAVDELLGICFWGGALGGAVGGI